MSLGEWIKLPGLFHRYELEQVVLVDGEHEYRFDPAGRDPRGHELIAVFCRERTPPAPRAERPSPTANDNRAPGELPPLPPRWPTSRGAS